MKKYSVYDEVKVNKIKPRGWLLRYLEKQRDGLTGHQEDAGYPYNAGGWMCEDIKDVWKAVVGPSQLQKGWRPLDSLEGWEIGPNVTDKYKKQKEDINKQEQEISNSQQKETQEEKWEETWVPSNGPFDTPWIFYEQNAYWVDGLIRCGLILGDDDLIEKGLKQIDYVLEHADSDGYLGPEILKSDPLTDRWPHTVFFRALMAYYSATGDERVIKSLERHYLRDSCDIDVIKRHVRELTNIEPILWTYEYTGNDRLLQLALEIFQKHNDDKNIWSPRYPLALKGMLTDWQGLWYINSLENYHGVTYNEVTKIAALVYMYTGNKTFLKGSVNAYHKMMRDHMLIDGIPSSDEHFMGRDAHNYHETCVISDLTWSAGYLLMATGQAEYADMIEKACFNAAPGVIKDDFKAIQYYSSVNQVIADRTSQHTPHRFSGSWTAFRPNHYIACCNGNVHRIMPNYIARMWMKDKNEGISAMLYGPSQISEKLGKEQQNVTITEETFYPFSDTIKFTINSGIPVTFKMSLRIPGWCSKASMEINSKPLSAELKPGTLAMIEREFSDGDVIILTLPMELKVSTWPRGGIGIERGPLVYALKIEEDWQVDELAGRRGTAGYPAWNLYAKSPWNYALIADDASLSEVEVICKNVKEIDMLEPWSIKNAPIELHVPARRVNGWEMETYEQAHYRVTGMTLEEDEEHQDAKGKISVYKNYHSPFGGEYMGEVAGFTPVLPDPENLKEQLSSEVETVTLVPFGCTKLRISVFPCASSIVYI